MPDEFPKIGYLKCENAGGRQFNDKLMRFKNYDRNFIAGFFSLEKLVDESLLEVQVEKIDGDKALVNLPYYHCHIFTGGKQHFVNKESIVYR